MRLLVKLLLASLAMPLALAAERDCSKEYPHFGNEFECAKQNLKLADTELNRVYKKLLKQFSGNTYFVHAKPAIRDAQRHWIKQRDLDCTVIHVTRNGNYRSIAAIECHIEKTKERSTWLRGMIY